MYGGARLRLSLDSLFLVVLGVHELGEDFSGMTIRIEVIRVHSSLPLASLLAAVTGVDVLVVVVVEVLVLVKMRFRHIQLRTPFVTTTVRQRSSSLSLFNAQLVRSANVTQLRLNNSIFKKVCTLSSYT